MTTRITHKTRTIILNDSLQEICHKRPKCSLVGRPQAVRKHNGCVNDSWVDQLQCKLFITIYFWWIHIVYTLLLVNTHCIHFTSGEYTLYTLYFWWIHIVYTLLLVNIHCIHFISGEYTLYTLYFWWIHIVYTLLLVNTHCIHFTYGEYTLYTLYFWWIYIVYTSG